MEPIDEFISSYLRELDYYEALGRIGRQQLEKLLQRKGIRAIVSSRAKSPSRLREKLNKRNSIKTYDSAEAIRLDVVDLAGVRVAVYFPTDHEAVNGVISEEFKAASKPTRFTSSERQLSKANQYAPRFAGYMATHHRVRLRIDQGEAEFARYAEPVFEIQVASVLMHAWAEVEHDLIYKPASGPLSRDELMIIDELNGLVLAGELALERLQSAIERRVVESTAPFANQYEVASQIFEYFRKLRGNELPASMLGPVDRLLTLLRQQSKDTPGTLRSLLESTQVTSEMAVASQLIDQLLVRDPETYEDAGYLRKLSENEWWPYEAIHEEYQLALGGFLQAWSELERCFLLAATKFVGGPQFVRVVKSLRDAGIIDDATKKAVLELSAVRNEVVHGHSLLAPLILRDARARATRVLAWLANHGSPEMQPLALDAMCRLGVTMPDDPGTID